jgi:hypothetical protein
MPLIQTFETNVADELPVLGPFPNVEENVKQLADAQQQQQAIVEERREAAEIERLGRFPGGTRHRPGAHVADDSVLAVVRDGMNQHTFRTVDDANVDFTRDGRPYDRITGRALLTKAEANKAIAELQQRGRRIK